MIDRFRSLPMARSAVLVGRTVADLGTAVIGLAFLTVSGLIVGWSIDASAASAAAGFALLLAFALAMSWLGTVLGLLVRSPDAVMGVVFITLFPLSFVSNMFVATDRLPGVLQTVAEYNPLSAVTAAVRELFGNPGAVPADAPWPLEHPVLASVLWCAAIIAVCAPLAVRRYRSAVGR
jgi:ABC-type polysaccharide/polyol phosphate export permease